jgi:hypothetical protein
MFNNKPSKREEERAARKKTREEPSSFQVCQDGVTPGVGFETHHTRYRVAQWERSEAAR